MDRWTVMVFMGADGIEGNRPLDLEAAADVAELKKVPLSANLQIFVERHTAAGADRQFTAGGLPWAQGPLPAQGPGSFAQGITLTRFMEWAFGAAQHNPNTDYTMLVIWGHAYRFAIGHTQTRTGFDALDFAELSSVLSAFQEKKRQDWTALRPNDDEPPKLDVVAFDACSLATIEMAYQLAPYARFLVASQVGVPLPGWPYDVIFERLATPEGRVMGPAEFGAYAVRRYCDYYKALDRPVTLSNLNLRQAPHLLRLTEGLARALAVTMDDDPQQIPQIARLFEIAQTAPDEPFVDVIDLCHLLVRYAESEDVRLAALALGDLLVSPTREGRGFNAMGEYKPFIVDYGRNSFESAGLHGVSLYAPSVAPSHDLGSASYFYEKFVFARETVWRDLVRALALPGC